MLIIPLQKLLIIYHLSISQIISNTFKIQLFKKITFYYIKIDEGTTMNIIPK